MTLPTIEVPIEDPAACEDAWDDFVLEWIEDIESFTLAELRTAFICGWKARGE